MSERKRRPNGIMCHMGTFNIKKELVCSDPCYKSGTWCSYVIKDGVEGEWDCYTTFTRSKKYGQHCVALSLVRKGYEVKQASKKLLYNEIGVDSGTCGFFNKEYYDKYHKEDLNSEWYDKYVCGIVSDYSYCHNIEDEGYWSQTSYGDGTYSLYADYKDKEIVRLTILYEWVNPKIINIVEGEDKVVFPINNYSDYSIIDIYLKKFGTLQKTIYSDNKYSITLDNSIRFKHYEQMAKIIELTITTHMSGIEMYYEYIEDNHIYPIPLKLWTLSKNLQKKIRKEIERQFNIDCNNEFEKWKQAK